MRVPVLLFALAATVSAFGCSQPPAQSALVRGPDHVLVWGQEPATARNAFESVGFVVGDGQVYPEGITGETIFFEDWTYLELLHFSDPAAARGNAQAQTELAFVAQGPGANSLAIEVNDIDAASTFLRNQRFDVADIIPDMVDPDGPSGPEPLREASWRDFHFARSPVSGVDLFFIQYPPAPDESEIQSPPEDSAVAHPNGARRLSAVWILVSDLNADAAAYERIGFNIGPVVDAPYLNARIRMATLGDGAIILVAAPDGLPTGFTTQRTGARVIGLSFEVGHANSFPEYSTQQIESPVGRSTLVQTTANLGLFLAFHEDNN